MTDSPSALAGYISSDFGDVDSHSYTERIGMNYVRCKVVGNDAGIYIPVQEGRKVSLATEQEIMMRRPGLRQTFQFRQDLFVCMMTPMPNYFQLISTLHFLIGPEGAHLNISGISGLASKTSYAMFLMKAIQDVHMKKQEESVAFI